MVSGYCHLVVRVDVKEALDNLRPVGNVISGRKESYSKFLERNLPNLK
jgi:hypothetical protein